MIFTFGMQKMLELNQSSIEHKKYPSTGYIDLENNSFIGEQIVITEKMDGENTSLYRDGTHARSIDSGHHPSRSWVKSFHAQIANDIPQGVKICGENLYARHSISYDGLPSYFMGFGVHDADFVWSWYDTANQLKLLGIYSVPVLFEGLCDRDIIQRVIKTVDTERSEGIVIRPFEKFPIEEFYRVQKWVRPGHVQTDSHWIHSEVIPNKLLGGKCLN
jgi:hypothetical protein